MQKSSGLRRSTGAGILLRVLRQSLKTVGKDENRARSALAVLMIVEWCVPQLWRNSWQLCAILRRRGCPLQVRPRRRLVVPPGARRRPLGATAGRAREEGRDGRPVCARHRLPARRQLVVVVRRRLRRGEGDARARGVHITRGDADAGWRRDAARAADGGRRGGGDGDGAAGPRDAQPVDGGKERPHGAASEEAVQAEMGVMREDLELLRTALQVMGRHCHRPHHNHTSSTSPRLPRYRCRSASRARSRRSSSPRRARRATTARAGCSGWASCWARASAGR